MSGDVTLQALKRQTFLGNRAAADEGTVIAGQDYDNVYIAGGEISNVTITSLASPLPIAAGGTGQITANDAFNALAPSQTSNSGKVLTTDGTNTSWVSNGSGTVTSVSVVTANGVSGSVANDTTTPAITLTLGAITPTSVSFSSTSGIIGTTTNNNAAAGSVGEVIESAVASGSAVSLTSGAVSNITSISLTAGDWDVFGHVVIAAAATTSVTQSSGGSSTISATLATIGTLGAGASFISNASFTNANTSLAVPVSRISLASTQTIYLVARAVFTVSTCTAYGAIQARRMR